MQRPQGIARAGFWGSGRKRQVQGAASKRTASRSAKVEGLLRLNRMLLALRENIKPLRKRQREEWMKAEPDKTHMELLEEAIWPLVNQEQQLLQFRDWRARLFEGPEVDEEVTGFAARIPDFPEQPDKDGFLCFPVPVPVLEGGTGMCVRNVYQALWEHVANSSSKGFVVSGNAGIGKSWWLVWVLIRRGQLMMVEARLDVLAGIPRQVFAGAPDTGDDPIAEVERATVNLKWDDLVSGFTPDQSYNSFREQVMEELVHEVLLRGGTFWVSMTSNAGILEILEQLDSSTNPAIYVLVPSQGIFNAWTHGMTVPTLPASASSEVKQHCTNLKQYVLYLEAITPQSDV